MKLLSGNLLSLLAGLTKDVRYGVRSMKRTPAFAATAIATLTLAIGASTAAFSIVNGILLVPLPFERPDQLVEIGMTRPDVSRLGGFFDLELVGDIGDESSTLVGLAASTLRTANIDDDGPPEAVEFSMVTAGYFDVLGVQPILGRLFASENLLDDGTKPAVVNYGYWQGKWGGTPGVIGQSLRFEGQSPMTIIGVLPPMFRSPFDAGPPASVWTPVESTPEGVGRSHRVIGRLWPDETIESAQTEIDVIAERLIDGVRANEVGVLILPLSESVVGQESRRTLLIFAVAVGMVLLIGVLNLVNLQASRISRRERELSIRGAIGASRGRLIRQMIAEAMVLTLSGAGLGFAVVYSIRDVVLANVPPVLPRMADVPVDLRAFAFAVVVALLSGLAIGIVPALRASRLDLNDTLKDGTPGATDTRRQQWLRSVLTIAQTSLAIVLLVGAGLLIQSFAKLIAVDPGFDPESVISARIALPRQYADTANQEAFFRALLGEIRSLPGVENASLTQQLPMGGGGISFTSRRRPGDEDPVAMVPTAVAADFGQVMSIPLLSGRWINEDDVAASEAVVVISQSIIRQFFLGQDPIGRRLEISGDADQSPRVIGVVRDSRFRMRIEPLAYFYVPYTTDLGLQSRPGTGAAITLVAKVTPGAVVSLDQAILRVEPNSVVTVTSMDRLIARDVEREQFQTAVLASFAGSALFLAILGVYSVVAFSTAQRSREIGLRMALGASARDVVLQMMRHGVVPAAVGIVLGLAASVSLTRILESYLFQVEAADSWVYAAVLVGGLALVAIASWIPARRAARFDPMLALRYE